MTTNSSPPHRATTSPARIGSRDGGGYAAQRCVAERMTVPVVHALEVVHVHDEQSEWIAVSDKVLQPAGQGSVEEPPVRKRGETRR